MIRELILGEMKVRDARRLLVEYPRTVRLKDSVNELLKALHDEPRSRHVYVLDDGDHLVGSVRMNAIVEYLFPFAAALERGGGMWAASIDLTEKHVRDIMCERPFFVTEDTTLEDTARIMIRQRINELPVVDEEHRLIGQVNVCEIIKAYLEGLERHQPQG